MSENKKKLLIVAENVTLAHFARCICIADSLNTTGKYEIALAADARFDSVTQPLAYTRYPLFSISSQLFAEKLKQGQPIYEKSVLIQYVKDDLDLLDQFQPDFILADFRLSLAISARLKQIPYAALVNAYWSPYANIDYPVPELALTRILGVSLAQFCFDAVRSFVFKGHIQPFLQAAAHFDFKPQINSLPGLYTEADFVFYPDIQALIPFQPLPSHHHFINPVLWSTDSALPTWWNQISDSKPRIFVTMGSSGNSELLPLILRSLCQMPVEVFCVTLQQKLDEFDFDNLHVCDYLPAKVAVNKADLVICNGGSPMVYQSILENTPCIGLPSNLDQYLMMSIAEKAGQGLLLRSGKVNQKSLQHVVNQALSMNLTTDYANQQLDIAKIEAVIDNA